MSKIILKYSEKKQGTGDDYGRCIEYFKFIGTPQLRCNGDIVIITSKRLRNKIYEGLTYSENKNKEK